ncbi:methylenetetrahydrofolate reductase-domain-containing protein [Zalerion maritima]|uniref:Methylenetetrahydrofolate reductase-domain-containing protein n=1 Tax=Zalerion maritima TaxID=339359 RepID=A0AAD5RIN6_9PEZI|nr:methylenetetrahydrofolate reductase-domain-containing protein [Zalerion maritima]
MEKITSKIAALPPDSDFFSLEFFPPKTAMGFSNLRDRLDRMSRALKPLFVNVTWGAGGSTADKSLELAELCQRTLGLTTCLHLTCTNMSRRLVDKALEDAKALGIRNILALRGDPPRKSEYKDTDEESEAGEESEFTWAIDLVKYIRRHHGDYFCIGVAAYPEGHADESHPLGQSLEHDLPYLVEKTQAGADFIMTQLFFDVNAYDMFYKTLREHPSGAFKDTPILPGLMPIQSYQMIKRTTKLSHASVPEHIMERLNNVRGDDEKVKSVGVDILCDIIASLRDMQPTEHRGFHFYTLNLEKSVSFIVERTKMAPPESDSDEEAVVDDLPGAVPTIQLNGSSGRHPSIAALSRSRRQSSIGSDPHNRVIVSGRNTSNPSYEAAASEAGIPAEPVNTRANTLAISEGEGVLGREATWDDFPNGRWGDARSPAYGEIDGYGVSLHVSVNQAITLWGHPRSREDISKLFVRHIKGELSAIPWSEEEFNAETATIQSRLLALNENGWWTVASQPAVNGMKSNNSTFGWGPASGFVFQKAFVEFFLPKEDWFKLREKMQSAEVTGTVTWYAVNSTGTFESSDFSGGVGTEAQPSTNAVTWGVFPGKEIVTPTIIEEVSFRAWAEEAFGIWGEWGRVYSRPGAQNEETRKCLDRIRQDVWLVNVIHHEYIDPEALWNLLVVE